MQTSTPKQNAFSHSKICLKSTKHSKSALNQQNKVSPDHSTLALHLLLLSLSFSHAHRHTQTHTQPINRNWNKVYFLLKIMELDAEGDKTTYCWMHRAKIASRCDRALGLKTLQCTLCLKTNMRHQLEAGNTYYACLCARLGHKWVSLLWVHRQAKHECKLAQ